MKYYQNYKELSAKEALCGVVQCFIMVMNKWLQGQVSDIFLNLIADLVVYHSVIQELQVKYANKDRVIIRVYHHFQDTA